MRLTPEQVDAVTRSGQDVCVVAGPGSGKTRVLAERFRWRVEHGFSPLRLLAVTFTEKAANELKQRLAREFDGVPRLREQVERAPVSTIDAFCAGLLRQHAIQAGLDPGFSVLDASEAYAELWEAAEQAVDALLAEDPEGVRALISALDLPDAVDALVRVHQAMRATATGAREGAAARLSAGSIACKELLDTARLIAAADPTGGSEAQRRNLEEVQDWARQLLAIADAPLSRDHFRVLNLFDVNLSRLKRANPAYEHVKAVKGTLLDAARQALVAEYYAPQRSLLWRAVELVDEIYRGRKEALNALDFADLEESAIRLLRDDESLRARVRSSFDEILMDELQDTNPLQASLLALIRRPGRLFAVGDINQSIYGFRYAEPETFRGFREALESAGKPVDCLFRNFRSRPDILRAAETVLQGADGIEAQPLEAARVFRLHKTSPSVEVIAAAADTMDEAAVLEAESVAARIRELDGRLQVQDRHTGEVRLASLADMVILVRNVNALPAFEQALHRAGIPCLIGRGKRFYEAREVTDLVHLLRIIVNPRDELSMAAVLRSPLVGVSSEALFRLKEAGNLGAALGRIEHIDLGPAGLEDIERLRAFRSQLHELRAFADEISPDRLLARVVDASGYEQHLSGRARANVTKLLGRVRDWHTRRPRPLLELVRDLEFLRASDPDEPSAPPEEASNAVRMLTVHAAKGLEFPIVFLAAMHKGISNDSPPLAFSPSAGLVARWLDPSSHQPVRDIAYTVFSEELRHRQSSEENRLLYVAMTRAEEHLVLSYACTKGTPRNWAARVARLENAPFPVAWHGGRALAGAGFQSRSAAETPRAPVKPHVTGQHDSSVTVTSVALFGACPRRYYIGKYLGWEAPQVAPRFTAREVDDDGIDAGEFGREVHDLLADITLAGASKQALELVARFKTSELGRRALAAPRVEREFEFLLAFDETIVEGRIDLWFEDADGLVLVDYKTDSVQPDDVPYRVEEYALQMRLYALALKHYVGRLPDRACLHFLRPDLVMDISLEPDELDATVEAVHALTRAQDLMEFPLREGGRCFRCGFHRTLCPSNL